VTGFITCAPPARFRRSWSRIVRRPDHAQHQRDASARPCFPDAAFTLKPIRQQHTGLGVTGRDDPTGGASIYKARHGPIPGTADDVYTETLLVIRDNFVRLGGLNYVRYRQTVVVGGTAGDDVLMPADRTTTRFMAMPATTTSTAAWQRPVRRRGRRRGRGHCGADTIRSDAGNDVISDGRSLQG
jgi:hypothetical protein